MRYTITVKGAPRGKGRPRFTKDGHAYTDEKTREYEKLIRLTWQSKYKESPLESNVEVKILAYYPIPKNWSRAKTYQAETELLLPTVKPDLDNVIKAVLDGLNGVAWVDDKQVVSIDCRKFYAKEPCVLVQVEGWKN